jgi:hypothetical protein
MRFLEERWNKETFGNFSLFAGKGGAERIRTAVRGFAGPCLTTRPPRQGKNHRIERRFHLRGIARGAKNDGCAHRREPCPGVDAASTGWSPGPLPGLRYVFASAARGRSSGLRAPPEPREQRAPVACSALRERGRQLARTCVAEQGGMALARWVGVGYGSVVHATSSRGHMTAERPPAFPLPPEFGFIRLPCSSSP